MARLSSFPVGRRVKATRLISWTLGEFDDYPFIARPGDLGTITDHDDERIAVYVEWDNDCYKDKPKCLLIGDLQQEELPIQLLD